MKLIFINEISTMLSLYGAKNIQLLLSIIPAYLLLLNFWTLRLNFICLFFPYKIFK